MSILKYARRWCNSTHASFLLCVILHTLHRWLNTVLWSEGFSAVAWTGSSILNCQKGFQLVSRWYRRTLYCTTQSCCQGACTSQVPPVAHLITGLTADTHPEMANRRLHFPALRTSSLWCDGREGSVHWVAPLCVHPWRQAFLKSFTMCVCVCVCVVCACLCVFIWMHTPTELSKRLHCQCVIEERGRDRSGTGEDLINLHMNAPRQIESPVSSCSEWGKQQTWLPHTYTSHNTHTHTHTHKCSLRLCITWLPW